MRWVLGSMSLHSAHNGTRAVGIHPDQTFAAITQQKSVFAYWDWQRANWAANVQIGLVGTLKTGLRGSATRFHGERWMSGRHRWVEYRTDSWAMKYQKFWSQLFVAISNILEKHRITIMYTHRSYFEISSTRYLELRYLG